MNHPRCCGSEDGEVVYGVDTGPLLDAMAQVWHCNSCGVNTVMEIVVVEHN